MKIKLDRNLWIGLGAVLIVAISLALYFGSSQASDGSEYETVAAEKGRLQDTVSATGTVRARQTALLTWQTSGTVAEVHVDTGDTVQKGELFAALDITSVPQNVILAQADLVSAQRALEDLLESGTAEARAYIALKDAREAYEDAEEYREFLNTNKITVEEVKILSVRNRFGETRKVPKIVQYKIDPDEETIADADDDLAVKKGLYEDALREYDRLVNDVDLPAAEARVAAAEAALKTAILTAPFSGTIISAESLPGDRVIMGSAAFRVDDLSHLLVDVEISEVDINSVEAGQPVILSFDAILGREYNGVVVEVARAADITQGAANFTVTVELTDVDEQVLPGMTAAVTILVTELEDVLVVPNRAVRVVENARVVYVLKDGAPTPVKIQLGATSDLVSQVAGGELQEGDLIILNPPAQQLQVGPGSGGGAQKLFHKVE